MVLGAVAFATGLSLSLVAPESCLPREGVPVVVTWKAVTALPRVAVASDNALPFPEAWFEIDGPLGTVWHRSSAMVEVQTAESWPQGKLVQQGIVLGYGWVGPERFPGSTGVAFPVAGAYRVRLHYDDNKAGLSATSPWVRLAVEDPKRPDDIAVLAGLRSGVHPGQLQEQYPESRYLAPSRLADIERRAGRVREGFDPTTGSRVELVGAELKAWQEDRYDELSAAFESGVEQAGAFAREFLLRAQRLARGPRSAQLKARLRREYPDWEDLPPVGP